MAILSPEPAPGFEQQPGESFTAFHQRTSTLVDTLFAEAAALPDGQYEGAILSFPIADGKALYRVQKAIPLTLQHIPYLDGYQLPAAHMRGLELEDVREEMYRTRARAALRARSRSATPT
jgi:hypothetical protein